MTPKLFLFDHTYPEANIAVEHAPNKISEVMKNRRASDVEFIVELQSVLKAFNTLIRKYGCFYISDLMIRINKNNQPVVWFS